MEWDNWKDEDGPHPWIAFHEEKCNQQLRLDEAVMDLRYFFKDPDWMKEDGPQAEAEEYLSQLFDE